MAKILYLPSYFKDSGDDMSWFPISLTMIESAEFQEMTASEKLFCLFILSEMNYNGSISLPDAQIAATLGMSLKTVQRSRQKLVKLGWLKVSAGHQKKSGHRVSTQYHEFVWARPISEVFFVQFDRFTFLVLLDLVRQKQLKPIDVITQLSVEYISRRNGPQLPISISKKELKKISGNARLSFSMSALVEVGSLEFTDAYHCYVIQKIVVYPDPVQNAKNAAYFQKMQNSISKNAKALAEAKGKPSERSFDEVLSLLQQKSGVKAGRSQNQKIEELVGVHGVKKAREMIEDYYSRCPGSPISHFLKFVLSEDEV